MPLSLSLKGIYETEGGSVLTGEIGRPPEHQPRSRRLCPRASAAQAAAPFSPRSDMYQRRP